MEVSRTALSQANRFCGIDPRKELRGRPMPRGRLRRIEAEFATGIACDLVFGNAQQESAGLQPGVLIVVNLGSPFTGMFGSRSFTSERGSVVAAVVPERQVTSMSAAIPERSRRRLVSLRLGPEAAARLHLSSSALAGLHVWKSSAAGWAIAEHLLDPMRQGNEHALLASSLALETLSHIAAPAQALPLRTHLARAVAMTRELVLEEPAAQHSVVKLAERAGVGPSTLDRAFRAQHGLSLAAYVREARFAAGERLLAGGASVEQAARASGYEHAANFSTAWRRRHGTPPRRG